MASPRALAAVLGFLCRARCATCPGSVHVGGDKMAAIIPTGWNKANGGAEVEVLNNRLVIPHMGGRAYFADTCKAGVYDHTQYAAYNLLGKTLRYTTDLSGAGCGCNAALYLVSMQQNDEPTECSDYYCDANKVCGVPCAEIDIQEANRFSWHSTLHTATDSSGAGAGYGGGGKNWNGPRNWTSDEYAPDGKCIDTAAPFEVAVSFPVDGHGSLSGMEVTLSQDGHSCPLSLQVSSYKGMDELSAALAAGMTPVLSYWGSNDMLWLDGKGADGRGPCGQDDKSKCSDAVMFYGFSIEDVGPGDASDRPSNCAGEVVIRVPASQVPADFREGAAVVAVDGGVEHRAEVTGVEWGDHEHTNSTVVISEPSTPAPAPAPSPGPAVGVGQPWVFVALVLQSCLMAALCVYAYNLHKRSGTGAGSSSPAGPERPAAGGLNLTRRPLPERSPNRNLLTGGWSPKEV